MSFRRLSFTKWWNGLDGSESYIRISDLSQTNHLILRLNLAETAGGNLTLICEFQNGVQIGLVSIGSCNIGSVIDVGTYCLSRWKSI